MTFFSHIKSWVAGLLNPLRARFGWRFLKPWECFWNLHTPWPVLQACGTDNQVISQAGKSQAISIIYRWAQLNEPDTKLSPSVEQTVWNCWTKGHFCIWHRTQRPHTSSCAKLGLEIVFQHEHFCSKSSIPSLMPTKHYPCWYVCKGNLIISFLAEDVYKKSSFCWGNHSLIPVSHKMHLRPRRGPEV